jgi:hypothetical protein
MKRTIKCGSIVFAICLFGLETAMAQYGGGFPVVQNEWSGLSASATNGSFGPRNVGGMMNSTTTNGAFGQRSMGEMMNSSRGAGTFTGSNNLAMGQGSAVNNGFVGGMGGINLSPNVVQPTAISRSFDARQYSDGINVLFSLAGRDRNNARSQLAEGQDIRSRSQIPIHISYALGFPSPPADMSALSAKLSGELSRLSGSPSPVRVQLEGQTAILRGTVASEHQRELAAELAMLEPRVWQVRNELQVASEGAPPQNSAVDVPTAGEPASQSSTSRR